MTIGIEILVKCIQNKDWFFIIQNKDNDNRNRNTSKMYTKQTDFCKKESSGLHSN